MRRGEIRWVDFEPARGFEADKRRPAVIVSNDDSNRAVEAIGDGLVTVVPFTKRLKRVYPFQVFVPASESGLPEDSKAQTEQIRAVTLSRVGELIGRVPQTWMIALDDALVTHLDL